MKKPRLKPARRLPTDLDGQLKWLIRPIFKYIGGNPILHYPERKQQREDFYNDLRRLPKDLQTQILVKILFLQQLCIPDEEEEKERREATRLRKKEEYYNRIMRNGKALKGIQRTLPVYDYLTYPLPKHAHRPEDIFNSFIFRLYEILKQSGLNKPYLKTISVLDAFCGVTYEEEALKKIVMKQKPSKTKN